MSDYPRFNSESRFSPLFVSSVMQIEAGWIDYNNHLNMAYYNVLFDRAMDEALTFLGCGAYYAKARKHSCLIAEAHVRYLRELHVGDRVQVTLQLLDWDPKRMRVFEHLFHASEGWISACSESIVLHVNMATKTPTAFPPEVATRIAKMKSQHAAVPVPESAGRRIAISKRP
jgi:acyl-CoA thioester hydrolase